MNTKNIIKREGGTQYQITVVVNLGMNGMTYRVYLMTREKGKRKWVDIPDTLHDYQFRQLSMEDREIHRNNNMLNYVTKEEMHLTKLKAWELLKPQV